VIGRPRQIGLLLLASLILGLTLLRFLDLQAAPFISDEPMFQMMIDQHLSQHTLPSHALTGNKGVVYGPTALWLYMPLRLFTDSVPLIVAFHALFQCLGFLLLFIAIRSSFGLGVALWTLVLVVASPYLFFYARIPWDNTFFVFLVPLVLFFLTRIEDNPTRIGSWGGLGLACGLVFNIHLMGLPVILAAWAVVLPHLWRGRRAWRVWVGSLAALLAMVGTMAPYLHELARRGLPGSQMALTEMALTHALPETFLRSGEFLSSQGMGYFLDQTMGLVRASLGPLLWANALAWVVRLLGWGALAWSLLVLLASLFRKRSKGPLPVVVRYGVTFFLFLLLYYYLVRPYPFHPHYFMSCFWLVPFFAAWAMSHFPWPLQRGLQVMTLILVVANTAFVVTAHTYIVRNHGTREMHYSSIPSEIRSRTLEICQQARRDGKSSAAIDLGQVPAVQDRPFEWFGAHLPECSGITFVFPSSLAGQPEDRLRVTVRYRSPSPDASLVVSMP
jgi:hypothetical protein